MFAMPQAAWSVACQRLSATLQISSSYLKKICPFKNTDNSNVCAKISLVWKTVISIRDMHKTAIYLQKICPLKIADIQHSKGFSHSKKLIHHSYLTINCELVRLGRNGNLLVAWLNLGQRKLMGFRILLSPYQKFNYHLIPIDVKKPCASLCLSLAAAWKSLIAWFLDPRYQYDNPRV